MTLYQIIKSLQVAQGNIAKQAILDANKDNELFKAYMKAVYDAGINYYQKKLPKNIKTGAAEFEVWYVNAMVSELAGRAVTGNDAKEWLASLAGRLTVEGQELLGYMLDRKIGASVGDTMVLKTWPGLFFTVPYQRCSLLDKKARERFGKLKRFYVQTKYDSSFAYVLKKNGKASVITRAGSIYPQEFCDEMATGIPDNTVLIGEMEVYRNGELLDRKTGNGILNSCLKNGEIPTDCECKHTAWDVLTIEEFEAGKSNAKYEDRLARLRGLFASEI